MAAEFDIEKVDPYEGINRYNPPRTLEAWIVYFRGRRNGQQLIRAILVQCHDGESVLHSLVKPKTLEAVFAHTDPPITAKELQHFRLDDGASLDQRQLEVIISYLWEKKILRDHMSSRGLTPPDKDAVLQNLHASLTTFLGIQPNDEKKLMTLAPGRYWIYRPSVHDPARFIRGLLKIEPLDEGTGMLSAIERYRDSGDGIWKHKFEEVYEGIMLQKSGYPLLMTALAPQQPDSERGSYRITSIVRALTDNGVFISMTGLASVAYDTGGINSTPVCFERIDEGVEISDELLQLIDASDLPDAVKNRLEKAWPKDGVVRC